MQSARPVFETKLNFHLSLAALTTANAHSYRFFGVQTSSEEDYLGMDGSSGGGKNNMRYVYYKGRVDLILLGVMYNFYHKI